MKFSCPPNFPEFQSLNTSNNVSYTHNKYQVKHGKHRPPYYTKPVNLERDILPTVANEMFRAIILVVLLPFIVPSNGYLINFQRFAGYPLLESKEYFTSQPTAHYCNEIESGDTLEIAAIRVRSGPKEGNPPQAIAFYTGDDCTHSNLALVVRYYQLSGTVEQTVAPDLTRIELTDGKENGNTSFNAPKFYTLVENIGYTSSLWSLVTELGLEPGDAAFRYTAPDGSKSEWRIAEGVIAVEDNPLSVEFWKETIHRELLNVDLFGMEDEDRLSLQGSWQGMARQFPADENLLLDETAGDTGSDLRKDLIREYERKIKIGKLARERFRYGPAPTRKNNPNMIELNPLVYYPGQSTLQDLEKQKDPTLEDILNDPDWDLYLPENTRS
ncbi:hypothetical protein H072_2212 [Dactylellina haptotyla CBS 200.50]|uniref:Uncharacterized protein n=1 Tax=Dactylellina haptotyla (strain CBS 200.50) TaxID=1284197 RepID=S8AS33_DACHA|nr:hypothetical protein H072_2212 [Dactylellina haptotyla CBS 200.50]